MERSDLRGVVGKKAAVNFFVNRSDLASFVSLAVSETKDKTLEPMTDTTEIG